MKDIVGLCFKKNKMLTTAYLKRTCLKKGTCENVESCRRSFFYKTKIKKKEENFTGDDDLLF